jgi:hypothetical protein
MYNSHPALFYALLIFVFSCLEQKRKKKKGKAIPVTSCGGSQSCETSRLPHFLDNPLTDGGSTKLL